MTRVTNTEVAEIFDTDLSTGSLDAWIDIAHEITDDVDGAGSLTDTRLKQIEKMLAAHYASTQDPRLNSASAETKSADYGKNEDYSTDYMAAAVSLDPTGVVANLNKQTATLSVPDSRNIE